MKTAAQALAEKDQEIDALRKLVKDLQASLREERGFGYSDSDLDFGDDEATSYNSRVNFS